jgi:hypothetical protein
LQSWFISTPVRVKILRSYAATLSRSKGPLTSDWGASRHDGRRVCPGCQRRRRAGLLAPYLAALTRLELAGSGAGVIECTVYGRLISLAEMRGTKAKFHFKPDNHKGQSWPSECARIQYVAWPTYAGRDRTARLRIAGHCPGLSRLSRWFPPLTHSIRLSEQSRTRLPRRMARRSSKMLKPCWRASVGQDKP